MATYDFQYKILFWVIWNRYGSDFEKNLTLREGQAE